MEDYYKDKEQIEHSTKMCFCGIVGIIIAMILAMLLSGCSPKVIYVPEVHTEYITRTDTFIRIDSVKVKDYGRK